MVVAAPLAHGMSGAEWRMSSKAGACYCHSSREFGAHLQRVELEEEVAPSRKSCGQKSQLRKEARRQFVVSAHSSASLDIYLIFDALVVDLATLDDAPTWFLSHPLVMISLRTTWSHGIPAPVIRESTSVAFDRFSSPRYVAFGLLYSRITHNLAE